MNTSHTPEEGVHSPSWPNEFVSYHHRLPQPNLAKQGVSASYLPADEIMSLAAPPPHGSNLATELPKGASNSYEDCLQGGGKSNSNSSHTKISRRPLATHPTIQKDVVLHTYTPLMHLFITVYTARYVLRSVRLSLT